MPPITFEEITPEVAQSRSRYVQKLFLKQPVTKYLVRVVGPSIRLTAASGKASAAEVLGGKKTSAGRLPKTLTGEVGNKASSQPRARRARVTIRVKRSK